jgi:membrane protease YdiL (CAAX protease family)
MAGPHGLRAGWGVLIFLLVAAGVMLSTVQVMGLLGVTRQGMRAGAYTAVGAMAGEAIGLLAVLAATGAMLLIERRRPRDYGLSTRHFAARLGHGLASGLGTMAVLAALLALTGAVRIDGIALHGSAVWTSGALWAVAFLMVGLFEELVFRGYLLASLTRGLNGRWAVVITSVLFGLAHTSNPGEGWVGIVCAVLISLVLAWSVLKTGTLWWAIGFHAAWDWAESFLFGLGDSGAQMKGALLATHPAGPALLSGGVTGPEGSLLCVLVIALAAALVRWTLPAALRPRGLPQAT